MRKLLVVSVVLNAVFVLGLLSREESAGAEGGGRGAGTPLGNGDVDGDGKINVSDPVYTLNWLFRGGPTLVPIECPPAGSGALPATGQIKCYDTGTEIDCASTAVPGQDGFYQAGCPGEGRFVDNQDGTVTDICTGLMWQKDTADADGNGTSGQGDTLHWTGALEYCESLDLGGHDDWRLPNVRELQSIVDYGRSSAAIDPIFGTFEAHYWSSTSYGIDPAYAWSISFNVGRVNNDGKGGDRWVRAVRGGL